MPLNVLELWNDENQCQGGSIFTPLCYSLTAPFRRNLRELKFSSQKFIKAQPLESHFGVWTLMRRTMSTTVKVQGWNTLHLCQELRKIGNIFWKYNGPPRNKLFPCVLLIISYFLKKFMWHFYLGFFIFLLCSECDKLLLNKTPPFWLSFSIVIQLGYRSNMIKLSWR